MDTDDTKFSRVTGVALAFTANDSSFASRMVQRVIKSKWSHVVVVFRLSDGSSIYYESFPRYGVRGALSMSKLYNWAAKSSKHRIEIIDMPWLSADAAIRINERAHDKVGAVGYGHFQIAGHWWFERVGHRFRRRMRNSNRRQTCAEYVARVCHPEVDFRCRDRDHFDAVTPGSIYLRLQVVKIIMSEERDFR